MELEFPQMVLAANSLEDHHYGTISFAVVAWRAAADSFSDLDYRRPALENAKVAVRASRAIRLAGAPAASCARASLDGRDCSQPTSNPSAAHFHAATKPSFSPL
jgi:hypothetical protein